MSEKTVPKWGETVHVDGEKAVVIAVAKHTPGAVKVADTDGCVSTFPVSDLDEYKPRTITIGDMEVPEPVQKPLAIGEMYWVVDITSRVVRSDQWSSDSIEWYWLKARVIQRTKEAAEQHRKALIRVSGGETE